MRRLRAAAALAYPLLIFAGLQYLQPRQVALLFAAVLGLRALLAARSLARTAWTELAIPAGLIAAVAVPTWLWNDPRALLFVPAAVNTALLVAFARSLRRGRPLVETLALLQEESLSPAQQRHCRSVTAVWCGFFAINALVCFVLAAWGPLLWWTVYTGFVSYLLMAALFGLELLVRSWRFHQLRAPLADPLLRRLFPEGPSA